jgi:hypothetical protein
MQLSLLVRSVPEFLSANPQQIREALASAFANLSMKKADKIISVPHQPDVNRTRVGRKAVANAELAKVELGRLVEEVKSIVGS